MSKLTLHMGRRNEPNMTDIEELQRQQAIEAMQKENDEEKDQDQPNQEQDTK